MTGGALREPRQTPKAKLRIGLLLHDMQVSSWQWALFQRIHESDYARISLVVLLQRPAAANNDTPHERGAAAWLRALVEAANNLLEKRVTLEPNAIATRDASELLAAVPTIRALMGSECAPYRLADALRSEAAAHDIDVFVNLLSAPLDPSTVPAAKQGVWSLQHGDERAGFGNPPGFWELLGGSPFVVTSLLLTRGDCGTTIVDQTFSSTDRTSLLRNNNSLYWKSVGLIARRLQQLHSRGPDALVPDTAAQAPTPSGTTAPNRPPTTSELARHIATMCARGVRDKIADRLYLSQWILMFHLGEAPCTQIARFRKMLPPRDRYWADPMILRRADKYYIFVEEVPFSTNKGHISVIVMDESGQYEPPIRVLERPYHLSYPFVFEHEGDTYMVPESADNRTVDLYRCVQFPQRWELAGNLLQNVCAVDATLCRHDGKWWLFANMVDSPAGSTWDELFLFYSEALLDGNWTPHRFNPIVSDVRKARPAGPVYRHAGKLYRPAQDCSVRYGYGIRLHEITRLSEHDYAEIEAATIMPGWDEDIIAIHTLTHSGRLTVVDALRPLLRL